MKEIQLTQGKVALVDDVDYEALSKFSWCLHCDGYAFGWVNGKHILMHRFIVNLNEKQEIDHINGNRLDNQRINLRICTHSQNQCNSKVHCDNSSGYKGSYWDKYKRKWMSCITVDQKNHHLGYYDTPEDAAHVYDEAAVKFHGEFARLNFPEQTTSGIVPANSADPG